MSCDAFTKGDEIRGAYLRVNNEDIKIHFHYDNDDIVYLSSIELSADYEVSNEEFEYINKLMYYGYGYDDHTALKWYYITQYLIYDYFHEVCFIDSSGDIVVKYEDEINELLSLINNDSLKPEFINNDLLYDKKNILIDTNSVLNNYESNYGVIDDNELIIDENNDKVIITNNYNNYINEPIVYNSGNNYVFKPGKLDKVIYDYEFNLLVGNLILDYFKDDIYCTECDNVKYSLYSGNTKLMDFNSSEVNEILLAPGSYFISERSRDVGFVKNDQVIEFEIVDGLDTKIILNQLLVSNEISLDKLNEDLIDEQSLFNIYDDDILVMEVDLSKSNSFVLGYGDYRVEHVTNTGYSLVDDINLKVRTNGLEQSRKLSSDELTEIPDTYKSSSNYLILLGVFVIFGLKIAKKCKN